MTSTAFEMASVGTFIPPLFPEGWIGTSAFNKLLEERILITKLPLDYSFVCNLEETERFHPSRLLETAEYLFGRRVGTVVDLSSTYGLFKPETFKILIILS